MRFCGRKFFNDGEQRNADLEYWEDLNGQMVFRVLIYNADMFLLYCNTYRNEDDARTIIADHFMPEKVIEGVMQNEHRGLNT